MTDAPRTPQKTEDITRRGSANGLARGLLLAAGLAGAAAPGWSAEIAKAAHPAGLSVSVKPARKICFEDRVEVTGTLVPHQGVEVGPDHEGLQVSQVLVEPLDEVTPGQILARLIPADGPAGSNASPVAIRSTVAGVVGRSWAAPGGQASPRQPLFQIIVGGNLDLQAELPVSDLAKLSVGQAVTISPLGLPDLSGKVQVIGDTLDPASQLGRILIAVSSPGSLRVGTFARGVIVVARRCGIGVPYSSVMYETDGTIVQVVVGDTVEARKVTIGLLSGNDIEVQSGLADAENVVTRAGPFLRDGEQVNPIKPTDQGGRSTPGK